MNELIDTHAHIYLSKFEGDIDDVLDQAQKAGVKKIYMPNIDGNSIEGMLQLEKDHPDFCAPMMGIHPCYVKDNYKEELETVHSWLEKRDFCAIGEIGIDLYWDKTYKNEQIDTFETQINWAKELDKPIVIHCRESIDLTIDIVNKNQDGRLKGIFHCFSGNAEQAHQITEMNFLLGIGGVVTFKNGGLDNVLPDVNMNSIVLETDSPYLAPTPNRGKRNEPAFIVMIAERVAEIMEMDYQSITSLTTQNALRLFNNE